MIGTQIRSINQLYRIAKERLDGVHGFSIKHNSCIEFFAFPCKKENNVAIIPVSDGFKVMGCGKIDLNVIQESHHRGVMKLKDTLGCTSSYNINSLDNASMMRHPLSICGINIIVENNFNEEYTKFLTSNPKIVSSVLGRYITAEYSIGKLLYLISDGNANFWAWAVKMVCRHNVSIFTIKHLFEFNSDHSQLVKNISKGNLIALSNSKETTQALNEVFTLRTQVNAKQTINWFNPIQKKLLREKLGSKDAVDILNNFSRLSKIKRLNFIRKVSTISDADEILRMMSFLCSNSHFNWDKDSLLNFIENVETINCEVVFNQNNIVIVNVQDYETVKRLGKTTNWCISKNRSYWEQYMGNRASLGFDMDEDATLSSTRKVNLPQVESELSYEKRFEQLIASQTAPTSSNNSKRQFIVFDFNEKEDSKESIVGITITNNRISHAHNFVNDNMLFAHRYENREDFVNNWQEILTNLWAETNEFEKTSQMVEQEVDLFLSKRNLSLSIFQKPISSNYEWSKDCVKNWLSQFVDNDEIDIWYEDETKLIFRSNTHRAFCLFPDINKIFQTFEQVDDCDDICGYVFHLDFSKHENDENKILLWCIINNNETRCEDVAYNAFNIYVNSSTAQFSQMIEDYSLPFDIIRRPNNLSQKMLVAIREKKVSLIFDILNKIKETQYPLSERDKWHLGRFLRVGVEEQDLSLLKTFMENYDIIDFIGQEKTFALIEKIFHRIICNAQNELNDFALLSDFNEFKQFKTDYIQSLLNYPDKNNDTFLKKLYQARATVLTMGYCQLFFYIIENINTTAFPTFYKKLIPKIIYSLQNNELIDSNYFAITKVVEKIFNDYGNKFDSLQIRDMRTLFMLLKNNAYSEFVLAQLDKFLSNADLHTRHISRLISDLRDIYPFIKHSTYTKCLNKICQVAQNQHIISEETAKQIVTAKH